jgi:hypothetical protein
MAEPDASKVSHARVMLEEAIKAGGKAITGARDVDGMILDGLQYYISVLPSEEREDWKRRLAHAGYNFNICAEPKYKR